MIEPSSWTRGYAYRVVIDKYPTPDGKPFTDQDRDVWDQVGEPDAPDWLPGAGAMSIWHFAGRDEVGAWEEGYNVPNLAKQQTRTFSRSTAAHRLARVMALGCEAHVERASLGSAERCEVKPAQLPPEEIGDGVPTSYNPETDPPF